MALDRLATVTITGGGSAMILAVTLMFFFFLYTVFPLFIPASGEPVANYPLPAAGDGETLLLAMDELNKIATRFTTTGKVIYFSTATGKVLGRETLPIPDGTRITAAAVGHPAGGWVAYGLSDGRALVVKYGFEVTYPGDARKITPVLSYPLGQPLVTLDGKGLPIAKLAVQNGEESATVVAISSDGRMLIGAWEKAGGLLAGEEDWEGELSEGPARVKKVKRILLDKEQRVLYLLHENDTLARWDLAEKSEPTLTGNTGLVPPGVRVTSIAFLGGDISLLVGRSDGVIAQWFPVRDAGNNQVMTQVRKFASDTAPIAGIAPEYFRKGFLAADAKGRVSIYHSTAHRTLMTARVSTSPLRRVAVSVHGDAMLAESQKGEVYFWRIKNEHPEVSWTALWGEVWYESYPEPDYVWQSSSGQDDFEPKFSLAPLAFGTLKAALFAMLFSTPLALFSAIYTAYFMAPRMRDVVKPALEIMNAFPTVIIGFLAGLWLAPLMEKNLPAFFSLLVILPVGILLFSGFWQALPHWVRRWVPDGWDALLLMPVVAGLVWFGLWLDDPLESWLFGGNMPGWLTNEMGIDFDQRNALVVGIAMGFAVIPTIFSIAEDAIYSVPEKLSHLSYALGATPWQTLWGVVLLTASPGMFSAIMIGFGRAVGETMIVIMATGNTPVMDMSFFQGMRTMAANIAVEMPESEVGSSHFRILFLAALVLFLFTMLLNTLAEVVRQRLRKRYASL